MGKREDEAARRHAKMDRGRRAFDVIYDLVPEEIHGSEDHPRITWQSDEIVVRYDALADLLRWARTNPGLATRVTEALDEIKEGFGR